MAPKKKTGKKKKKSTANPDDKPKEDKEESKMPEINLPKYGWIHLKLRLCYTFKDLPGDFTSFKVHMMSN